MATTWEEAAVEAADRIWDKYKETPSRSKGTLGYLRAHLDITFKDHVERDDLDADCAVCDLVYLGALGLEGVRSIVDGPFIQLWSITNLAAEKQHDYGQGNIQRFGLQGILIRMSDKVERLKNLASRDDSPAVAESVLDAWRDLVGYAIVGIMFLEGTFSLPLAQDVAIVNQFMVDTEPTDAEDVRRMALADAEIAAGVHGTPLETVLEELAEAEAFDPEQDIPWPVYCNELGDFYANFDGSWVPLTLAEGMYTFGTSLEGVFVPQWRI